MSDDKQDKNAEHERIVRERSQLEQLHRDRIAAEQAAKPAPSVQPNTEGEARGDLSHTPEVGPEPGAIAEEHGGETHGLKPTDDEIITTLVAFYGVPATLVIEWLASIRAVRRSVMLSIGDA